MSEAATLASGEQLDTPYWRLQPGRTEGSWALLSRLGGALGPTLRVLHAAAPRAAALLLLLQLLGGATTAWALLQTSQVLDQLLRLAPADLRLVLPAFALLLLAHALRMGLDTAAAHARAWLRPAVRRLAEQRLTAAALEVDLRAFDDDAFYDQLHRARDRGVLHLEGATECLIDSFGALLGVAAALLALACLQPLLLPVLLLALAPEAWAALRSARLQIDSMDTTVALSRQSEMMIELATQRESAAELRAHQARDLVMGEFERHAQALMQHLRHLGQAEARAQGWGQLLCGLGLLACFAALGWMLHLGWLALAVAGTTVLALRQASQALKQLTQGLHELFEKGLYIGDYEEFLHQARAQAHERGGQTAPDQPGQIRLDGLGFSYPGGQPVLQDINLQIEPGQTIALVGENGSGKTTLAKLIAGLYQPSRGRILWDGRDCREFSRASLIDRVVTVLQHPIRWPKSARLNIRAGRHAKADPGDHALLAAAREARADEVIERLSQGWETLLSRQFRGGADLSGGQWQRLAVARGLFRDAPLVIWDEPTAPLDAKAEAAVFESLQRLAGKRTVVLITHRLASVRQADRIFFLERGRLVEQGRHHELMALGGRYAELYGLQTKLHGLDA